MPRLLPLLMLLLSFQSTASERCAPLEITAGEWPPYLSRDLPEQGVIAHLIRDLLRAEGYCVQFKFLPWPRAYAEAAAGKQAATAIWMHKPEREADFLYSDALLDEQFVIFHLRSRAFDWQTLDDLRGLRLGGGLEYSYGPEFDAAIADGRLQMERVSSDQQNFDKLLRGRIDLYPQEINVGYFSLRQSFPPRKVATITHHPKVLLKNQSFLLFPKAKPESQALRSQFNRRLADFRQRELIAPYFADLRAGRYQPVSPQPPETNP